MKAAARATLLGARKFTAFVCTRNETSRLGTPGPFPARHTRETMGTSPERLERSFEDSYCLTDLPSEVLVLILEYLPLQDLANVRLVSSVCSFVDGHRLKLPNSLA